MRPLHLLLLLWLLPHFGFAQLPAEPAPQALLQESAARARLAATEFDAYHYRHVNHALIFVENAQELADRRILKLVRPIIQDLTVKPETDSSFIPLVNLHNLSEYYVQPTPERKKELVNAYYGEDYGLFSKRLLGQISGKTFFDLDFRERLVTFFNHPYHSPLHPANFDQYDYRLTETDSSWHIAFIPDGSALRKFQGEVVLGKESLLIQHLQITQPELEGLNYVENFVLEQSFQPVVGGFAAPDETWIAFDLNDPYINLVDVRVVVCGNTQEPKVQPLGEEYFRQRIFVADSAKQNYVPAFSQTTPPCWRSEVATDTASGGLSKEGFLVWLGATAVRRYIRPPFLKEVEFGPLLSVYGQNPVEEHRLQMGFRTTPKLSANWRTKGYAAYGLGDERWKYSLQFEYFLNRHYWTILGLQHRYDLRPVGEDPIFFSNSSFSAISTQLGLLDYYWMERQNKAWFETDYFRGLRVAVLTEQSRLMPQKGFVFGWLDNPQEPEVRQHINLTEARLQVTLAPDEFFIIDGNSRYRIDQNAWPRLTTSFTHGFKGLLGGDFSYQMLAMHLFQRLRSPLLGRTEYWVLGKKIFSDLPQPLLFITRGNGTFMIRRDGFNMMEFNEFVSDRGVQAYLWHHFDGLLLGRVPLLRKTMVRAVVAGGASYGDLSTRHARLRPQTVLGQPLTEFESYREGVPYTEIGYGLENIFKVLRVMVFHRLTYLNPTPRQNWGVKGSIYLNF